ncbi:ATP-grasp domain-containing protein [Periweissella fabaria]|uniref:ATP-grasp domain-containing protein n=1 Tax=Periweissella fabaria TaxID=546157 RepID=A0ABM8Z493_9LACO|nr:ATP-grasp domain-containing protein [Periweissella fabaria]MCM0597478.1 ATP-grasp domain-containing protein [Periweissella fabaria]CAH0416018.1 hypothetical protein WFA24289_00317 [Periweissella fabaria]
MNIVILSPLSNTYIGALEWAPIDQNTYIYIIPTRFTTNYQTTQANIKIITVDEWNYPSLQNALSNIAATMSVNYLIHCDEHDVEVAAQLREQFQIPGQRLADAVLYRNKFSMKQYVAQRGIAVPQYQEVQSIADIKAWQANFTGTSILKPIDGAGAKGITVITATTEIATLTIVPRARYIIEEYIDWPLYHIDGLVNDDKVMYLNTSKYLGQGGINYLHQQNSGSIEIERDTLLNSKITTYVERLLTILPHDAAMLFHLEVFINPVTDEIYFCEIGNRLGGGRINEELHDRYSIWPIKAYIQAVIGGAVPVITAQNNLIHGFIFIAPDRGTLIEIPNAIPVTGIYDYHVFGKVGKIYDGSNSINQAVVAVSVRDTTHAGVYSKLREIEQYLATTIKYAQ